MPSNFNHSTPAAPAGKQNVTFQTDGGGNDSAYVPIPTIATCADADVIGPTTNQLLQWNGTAWVNASVTLEQLSDVDVIGPTTNQLLQWNGSAWVNASVAAGDFVKIAQNVVGTAAATVTFSSIPATYRNLKLVVTGRTDAGGTDYVVNFNGDSGANYQSVLAYNGSAAGATAGFTQTSAAIGCTAESTAPTHQAGVSEIMIYDYAGTTFYKSATGMSHRLDTASAAYVLWYAVTWNSTAAINAIMLSAGAGNFVTGSVFTLYGIN